MSQAQLERLLQHHTWVEEIEIGVQVLINSLDLVVELIHRDIGLVCDVELVGSKCVDHVIVATHSLVLNDVEIDLVRLTRQV